MDTKAAFDREGFGKAVAELTGANQGYIASKRAGSEYEYGSGLHAYWLVWKASRAAIEIDISPENIEAVVTTCHHLIEREGYSEHSANLRLIAKLALPMLTSHGIRIKGKTE